MVMNVADALAAYRQNGAGGGVKTSSIADSDGSGGSFADALKGFSHDVVNSLEASDKATASAATGKADIASIVTAVNSAEMMLQTVVTIRDKVIAAYQDITKTSI